MCLKLFVASYDIYIVIYSACDICCDIYVICNVCDIYVVIWGPLYVKNKKRFVWSLCRVPGTRHTAKWQYGQPWTASSPCALCVLNWSDLLWWNRLSIFSLKFSTQNGICLDLLKGLYWHHYILFKLYIFSITTYTNMLLEGYKWHSFHPLKALASSNWINLSAFSLVCLFSTYYILVYSGLSSLTKYYWISQNQLVFLPTDQNRCDVTRCTFSGVQLTKLNY